MSKWTYCPDDSGNAIFDEVGLWLGEPATDRVGYLWAAAPNLLEACKAALKCIAQLTPFPVGDAALDPAIEAAAKMADAVRAQLREAIREAADARHPEP